MKLDLKSLYKQEIVPAMIEAFGYKNIEQVPMGGDPPILH